jgi:hypothetical protein
MNTSLISLGSDDMIRSQNCACNYSKFEDFMHGISDMGLAFVGDLC